MVVPDKWKKIALRSVVADIQAGFAQSPKFGASVGQIRTHNVTPEGKISLDGIKSVSPSDKEIQRYSLLPGDIVFNNTNSEEWVGKTALYQLDQGHVFSNHMTRLRVDQTVASPDFVARYLHYLWSIGFSRTRAKRWVSQAAIEQSALLEFPLHLPPIKEQGQIVAILQKADRLSQMRKDTFEKCTEISSALFREIFGDPAANPRSWQKVPVSHFVEQLEGGLSIVGLDDANSRNRVIKISAVTSGEFLPNESKSLPATYHPPSSHFIRQGDFLFSRANTEELVGATCYVFEAPDNLVLPDKIWRFIWRADIEIEPLFVSHLFAQPAIRKQLSGLATGSGGSMKNIPKSRLLPLKVIFPDLSAQRLFVARALRFRAHVHRARIAQGDLNKAIDALTASAFNGELTRAWRLKSGVTDVKPQSPRRLRVKITEIAAEERPWQSQTHRRWLKGQVNEFQSSVRLALQEWKGTFIPTEDMESFVQSWPIEDLTGHEDHIKRALNELAGLGLIARISIPNGSGDYVTAYRGLREDELSRVDDLGTIKRALGED